MHLRLLTAACVAAICTASGLVDNPIVGGSSLQYLDGESWLVSNGSVAVAATVPGDLLTDLQMGEVIGDPLFELNFLDGGGKNPLWDAGNWSYSVHFQLAFDASTAAEVLLVFDSVKMAADVSLNGVYLGYTADQFLRYRFAVLPLLLPAPQRNTLTVTFTTSQLPASARSPWQTG